MSPEHANEMGLQGQSVSTSQFAYTSQSGCDSVNTIDDVKEFSETIEVFFFLSFSPFLLFFLFFGFG